MTAIPVVNQRWQGICQHQVRPAIDLSWATRRRRTREQACRQAQAGPAACAITNEGLTGLVRRFPGAATAILAYCGKVTYSGVMEVAKGCPNLQHLDRLLELDGRRACEGR